METQAELRSADDSQKLSRFTFSGLPPLQTAFFHGKKGGVAIAKASSLWGHGAMAILTMRILDGKPSAGHHTCHRSQVCEFQGQRDISSSSNTNAPILNKSPDQLRKHELWLVWPPKSCLGHKTLAFLSAPLVRAEFVLAIIKRVSETSTHSLKNVLLHTSNLYCVALQVGTVVLSSYSGRWGIAKTDQAFNSFCSAPLICTAVLLQPVQQYEWESTGG